MLGFSAEATNDQFKVDEEELESAQWMTRQDLLNSPENEIFKLPRKDSLSRRLIEDWLRLKL
jgi:NAD+ diphosphatase